MKTEEAVGLITSIAEMVGGKVMLSDGEGDTINISIVLNRFRSSSPHTLPVERRGDRVIPKEIPPEDRKKVLHVEDVDRAGDLIHYYLRNHFDVATVNTGEAAVALVLEEQFDFILMDLDLGAGMDGFEVTQLVRKMPEYHDVPIIAITGRATKKDVERSIASGCNGFLAKPFLKDDLLKILDEFKSPE